MLPYDNTIWCTHALVVNTEFVDTKFWLSWCVLFCICSQVVIIDVVSPDTCVCQTEEGRLLEGMQE